MIPFDPLPFAIPGFFVLILAEMIWARWSGRHRAYELQDTAVSLGLGLGSVIAGALSAGAILTLMNAVHATTPLRISWFW